VKHSFLQYSFFQVAFLYTKSQVTAREFSVLSIAINYWGAMYSYIHESRVISNFNNQIRLYNVPVLYNKLWIHCKSACTKSVILIIKFDDIMYWYCITNYGCTVNQPAHFLFLYLNHDSCWNFKKQQNLIKIMKGIFIHAKIYLNWKYRHLEFIHSKKWGWSVQQDLLVLNEYFSVFMSYEDSRKKVYIYSIYLMRVLMDITPDLLPTDLINE
jgi:hypothetical protein